MRASSQSLCVKVNTQHQCVVLTMCETCPSNVVFTSHLKDGRLRIYHEKTVVNDDVTAQSLNYIYI